MRVDLLLEHAQAVADADDLLEERLDRQLLALHVRLAGDEPEGAAAPAGRQLEVHVDPALIPEDLADRLPDAIGLGIALLLLDLEAVEPVGHSTRVAAAEHDHVLTGLVGDDATGAELEMADDRPDAEAGPGCGCGWLVAR